MSLVCGDIHGNYNKADAFLKYKPEEEHIFIGDYFDSFIASDESILLTFDLIVNSGAVMLCGNHDLHYFKLASRSVYCSGRRDDTKPYTERLEKYKNKLLPCAIRDNFFLSHGGLSAFHGKRYDTIEDVETDSKNKFTDFITTGNSNYDIFDIGHLRGGFSPSGGLFWCSIGYEKLDKRFNQVVGHTRKQTPYIQQMGKKIIHVAIDAPQFFCFNTETKELEDFMFEEYKTNEGVRFSLEKTF